MANITNEINQIKTAIYGKEVRGALASGLEALNDELSKPVNIPDISEMKASIATNNSNINGNKSAITANSIALKDIEDKEKLNENNINDNATKIVANTETIKQANTQILVNSQEINGINSNVKNLEDKIASIPTSGGSSAGQAVDLSNYLINLKLMEN